MLKRHTTNNSLKGYEHMKQFKSKLDYFDIFQEHQDKASCFLISKSGDYNVGDIGNSFTSLII